MPIFASDEFFACFLDPKYWCWPASNSYLVGLVTKQGGVLLVIRHQSCKQIFFLQKISALNDGWNCYLHVIRVYMCWLYVVLCVPVLENYSRLCIVKHVLLFKTYLLCAGHCYLWCWSSENGNCSRLFKCSLVILVLGLLIRARWNAARLGCLDMSKLKNDELKLNGVRGGHCRPRPSWPPPQLRAWRGEGILRLVHIASTGTGLLAV
jgi:hypothetical protein